MEDDSFDESFIPFTKKRTCKTLCSQSTISFSQRSFSSKQLSLRYFLKPKDDSSTSQKLDCEISEKNSEGSSSSDLPSPLKRKLPRKSISPKKSRHSGQKPVSESVRSYDKFCPTCQVPFDSLHVLSGVHAASCNVSWEDLEECPAGESCSSIQPLHFRDYAHQKLAMLRSSATMEKKDDDPVSGGLTFKGNVLYKDTDDRRKRVQNCVRTSTLPCDECTTCQEEEDMNVEMNLSPPVQSVGPKTPVKVNLTYNEQGWHSMGVDMCSESHLEEIDVAVCDCSHCIEMKCTVSDCSRKEDINILEPKLFVKLEDLGVKKLAAANKQLTVISRLKPDGGSSTKLDISLLHPPDKKTAPKINNESAKVKWKELISGVKEKGFNAVEVMSNDSLASSPGVESSRWGGKKQCPFYKRIPDTSFVVDAFQYGVIPQVSHYFLSHFHADHYGGLRKSFNKPIVCSPITARLVQQKLGVDSRYLQVIELEQPQTLRHVTVTALDANHCPGSLMFLFQLADGRNFLHVGDFRADPSMESYPCFWNLTIDKLYLDTTYCNPRYTFPAQVETVTQVVEICRKRLEKNSHTLVVSGTYTIGKEKVFVGIAEALDLHIWAKRDKRRVLECLEDPAINSRLVDNPWQAQVHVLPMKDVNVETLKAHLQQCRGKFNEVVGFKPSGWELNMSGDPLNFKSYSNSDITIYSVPYSEHSSFTELRRFVQFLKPSEIIPTVNMGSAEGRATMQKHFQQWLKESATLKTQTKLTSYVTNR